jgi:hypothetical protein
MENCVDRVWVMDEESVCDPHAEIIVFFVILVGIKLQIGTKKENTKKEDSEKENK